MTASNDREQIDLLIKLFFEQFDNRNGKIPSRNVLDSLFATGATIVHCVGKECVTYSIREFVEPRMRLLTTGEITDFYEWETSAATNVVGAIASRISNYSKHGILRGKPYDGLGSKFFLLGCFLNEWRITAIAWSDEIVSPILRLPEK